MSEKINFKEMTEQLAKIARDNKELMEHSEEAAENIREKALNTLKGTINIANKTQFLLEVKNAIEGYYYKEAEMEKRVVGEKSRWTSAELINKVEVVGVKNWSHECTDPSIIIRCVDFDIAGPVSERLIGISWNNDRILRQIKEEFGDKIL